MIKNVYLFLKFLNQILMVQFYKNPYRPSLGANKVKYDTDYGPI